MADMTREEIEDLISREWRLIDEQTGKLNNKNVVVEGKQLPSVWDGLRPAVRTRLSQAVDHLLETGKLNRADIERVGEVSTPQASLDMAEIISRLPNLMRYDPSAKCYVLANSQGQIKEPSASTVTIQQGGRVDVRHPDPRKSPRRPATAARLAPEPER